MSSCSPICKQFLNLSSFFVTLPFMMGAAYSVESLLIWVSLMFVSCMFEVMCLWQGYPRSDAVSFSEHHSRGFLMLIARLPGHINLEPLMKVMSARFLHSKSSSLFFAIRECLGGDTSRLCKYHFSPLISNHGVYTPPHACCLQQLLL